MSSAELPQQASDEFIDGHNDDFKKFEYPIEIFNLRHLDKCDYMDDEMKHNMKEFISNYQDEEIVKNNDVITIPDIEMKKLKKIETINIRFAKYHIHD